MSLYQLDFGVFTIDGVVAGATVGGASLDSGMEWRMPEIDGARGALAGITRLVKTIPTMVVVVKDWNQTLIDKVNSGSSTGYTVTAAGKTSSGGDAVLTLLNAVCTKSKYGMVDKEEGGIELEFTGCFLDIGGAVPYSVVAE